MYGDAYLCTVCSNAGRSFDAVDNTTGAMLIMAVSPPKISKTTEGDSFIVVEVYEGVAEVKEIVDCVQKFFSVLRLA